MSVHHRALSPRERRTALALAEATMPHTTGLPGASAETIDRFERLLGDLGPTAVQAARAALWMAEARTVSRHGRGLAALSPEERERSIADWAESGWRPERWALRALLTPLKAAHFDDPRIAARVGCKPAAAAPVGREDPRWTRQMIDGRSVDRDLVLDCEVVVIGTGAGGAATAYELARRGRAVLLLEAGEHHARASFDGRAATAYRHMYGGALALGNVAVPIPTGRGVGGTTTINSGTCYRARDWTLERWGERYGLTMLSATALSPFYDRVESMLGVAEAPVELLGGSARVVARGAELLGLSHHPLRRDAPGCDGQGVCCFGCPTGAKRSTDVSYIPAALDRGAQLVTSARVARVNVVDGRARGVTARLGSGRTLEVRAEAVVVAAGTLATPLLLGESGLCASSGWLGKNLSIHPASKVMALFGEVIDMSRGIPQSYAIDQHARDGLMFEGASTPIDVAAVAVPWVGARFMDLMARYRHLATFGFLVRDRSRGEVRRGPGGVPIVLYSMCREDVATMQRGVEILSDVFLRAGAERVLPMVTGCDEIRSQADLDALRRRTLRAGDIEVSAFHPLGTCRMGTDPSRSCIGPDHEAHDVAGLFVADGSAIPSSLGVNPQLTIMALALRAGEIIDARVDRLGRTRSPAPMMRDRALHVQLEETMNGSFRLHASPRDERPLSFSLRACSGPPAELARTGRFAVVGELSGEGFGVDCPVQGTLTIGLLSRPAIAYDFTFVGDDGATHRFRGEKRLRASSPLHAITHLPARICDASGTEVASANVVFDLRGDLVAFLRSWRVSSVRAGCA